MLQTTLVEWPGLPQIGPAVWRRCLIVVYPLMWSQVNVWVRTQATRSAPSRPCYSMALDALLIVDWREGNQSSNLV